MKGPVRLGAVDYLNARPLVHGIGPGSLVPGPGSVPSPEVPLSLRFDLPAVCARLLATGEIDLGLIPTIAYYDRPDSRVIPGVGIISDGPVDSVALFTKRPIREVRTLALDTSSRTSVALTRILCARVFQIDPVFTPAPPDLPRMLRAHDAALLIGDPALFVDHQRLGPEKVEKIDLGQAWTEWTGRPFVWAFWSGLAGAADTGVGAAMQRARDAGVGASDAIADEYCAGDPVRQSVARRYLRDHIKYLMGARELEGLERFYREAAALAIIEPTGGVRFF